MLFFFGLASVLNPVFLFWTCFHLSTFCLFVLFFFFFTISTFRTLSSFLRRCSVLDMACSVDRWIDIDCGDVEMTFRHLWAMGFFLVVIFLSLFTGLDSFPHQIALLNSISTLFGFFYIVFFFFFFVYIGQVFRHFFADSGFILVNFISTFVIGLFGCIFWALVVASVRSFTFSFFFFFFQTLFRGFL